MFVEGTLPAFLIIGTAVGLSILFDSAWAGVAGIGVILYILFVYDRISKDHEEKG